MKKFFFHRLKTSTNPKRESEPYQLVLRCEESFGAEEVDGIPLQKRNAPTKYLSIFAPEPWSELHEQRFTDSPYTDVVLKALGV